MDPARLPGVFGPIRGLPSWDVKRGHGSFVTLQFGQPCVEIDETIRSLPADVAGERLPVPQRSAQVRGEWQLWIYCCNWSLSWRDRELAHSESTDLAIDRALAVLNGQSIAAASAQGGAGRSALAFDLECVLDTWPYDDAEDDAEQWMFFQPSGGVLRLLADRRLQAEVQR